jgi:broad specificity phosphatase PhoE
MFRARKTADLCTTGPVVVWEVQEFGYLPEDKKTGDEYEKLASNAYWKTKDPNYRVAPGTETFCEFLKRVAQILQQLEGKNAVVFTHSGFIKAVYWIHATGGSDDMEAFQKFKRCVKTPNAGIAHFTWNGKRWYASPVQVEHLPLGEQT